ncbi:ABC transporter substrate-binding protein [Peristeroidobacter soli]|jgi:peptide/nickel transport system substrate-binding protein|uniref:ABC transporter substrate-binding protein n=1 Tax=Peristeroidobacter soli TaxID=2497877 RepID=UPI001300B07F|nr:ABC transporter substrate-binding protein [Peristeroidobacter soli]
MFMWGCLCFAGPGGAAANAEPILRVALASDLRSTNPGINRDSVTDWVMTHVVEGLVATNAELAPAPMLAESWSVSDDGREYTFRLRPDVKFQNGATLRAAHVVWSWRRMLDPQTRWPCRSWYDGNGDSGVRIDAIQAVDEHTVRFRLREPDPLFLYRLADVQCHVAIIHPESLDANGNWRWPIGTGPYRLKEWRRGRYVELERFDGYSLAAQPASGFAGRKEAFVRNVRLVVIPDASSAKLAVLSGEIDIWPLTAAEALPELRRDSHVDLLQEASRDWSVLLMQNRSGVMSNPALRAAIASALDPELISQSTMHASRPLRPYGVPAEEIAPDILARIPPAYQPQRTQELLRQAGYKGELIEIDVSRETGSYFNDAIVVHALLVRAGINARVRSMDWATQFKRYLGHEYQLSLFGYTGRATGPMMYSVFVCDPVKRVNCVVHTPRALAIMGELNTSSPQRWPVLMGELEMEIAHDRSIIGLYAPLRITTVRRSVVGYETWALGMPRFWGVRVDAPGQTTAVAKRLARVSAASGQGTWP